MHRCQFSEENKLERLNPFGFDELIHSKFGLNVHYMGHSPHESPVELEL